MVASLSRSVSPDPSLRTSDTSAAFVREHDFYWRGRHFPPYEDWHVTELKDCVSTSGLSLQGGETASFQDRTIGKLASADISEQDRMIAKLEAADLDAQFPRFLELAADLRNSIYEFYLAAFADQPLHMPTMPPLARANRLLREEVSPLLFKNCTFEIKLVAAETQDPRWPRTEWALRMRPESALFFTQLTAETLATLRKLCITAETVQENLGIVFCRILIDEPGRTFRVHCRQHQPMPRRPLGGLWLPYPRSLARLSSVEQRVTDVLETTVAREGEGGAKLHLSDVYALRKAVEQGLWE
ncbi:hypothetical protein LTR36_005087 [Oleoguttula mirabilis]|uniref:Uncharacterized protein n=1 Tax=Oleoguttula mirabilis TaxID=1507867 RepID=A0AAV9JVZ7_9PEZI|nr:hypothetical protein LTR36_005087 [Oleoguttula mirabilis]